MIRLYADYLHEEYGNLDSDYVFVNLWGQPFGRPWGYPAVYDLVLRLRRVTGIDFDPHLYRHTYATRLLRKGTPIEVVSTLLGHSSIATTSDIYGDLSVEDARRALEAAGLPDRAGGAVVAAAKLVPSQTATPGLLGRLMAAVRPEFRVDILVPEHGALVFDSAPCRVPGCVRQPRTRGLGKGHYYKWKDAGRPDIDVFAASASPEGLGRKDLTVCVVDGCRHDGARRGLCVRHHGVLGAGRQAGPHGVAGRPLPGAGSRASGLRPVLLLTVDTWKLAILRQHRSRWEFVGRPDVGEFTRSASPTATTASTSGRWAIADSSSSSCNTLCNADATGGKSKPRRRRASGHRARGR